jgi:protein-S-isoprenylcysteine O-methyltransferase Ste14
MIGRFLYGLVFVAFVPAALALWARAVDQSLTLPVPPLPAAGPFIAGTGLAVMLAGMWALLRYGHGLPMNAFPPTRYVRRGVYGMVSHPIYAGFALLVLGIAWSARSPAGIWLVTPVISLAMVALVLGYERLDLGRRFGVGQIHRPVLSLPPDEPASPSIVERIAVLLLVGIPWVVSFEAVCLLGPAPDAVPVGLPFERTWPVLQSSEALYALAYPFVLATPFVVRSRHELRDSALLALVATAAVIPLYLILPFVAPPRPFEATSALGRALLAERAMCNTVATFPSFHVIWALLAARAWRSRSRAWGTVGSALAVLICISCLTTGMHVLVDIAAGVAAFGAVLRWRQAWDWIRRGAERRANSWREWRWGRIRLLSYALPASAAAASGFLLATMLGGRPVIGPLFLVFLCGLLGAALWAQRLEGSERLSRPFGYFGSVLGVTSGVVLIGGLRGNGLQLAVLVAMAAPWMQAIGRLRCLVQGCCFGAPAPETIGIRYFHPRSRVCTQTEFRGVPLYPTPLYSMLSSTVIGLLLWRLWSIGAALTLILGAYFILVGLARFVEEAYRGEPQTPIVGGLRLYQWLAIVWLIGGIVVSAVPSEPASGPVDGAGPLAWITAVVIGVVVGGAMGVDFPESTRRFARLAPP